MPVKCTQLTRFCKSGDGFIVINDSHRYNLPPGKSTPQGEVYDISLFHQLHCLRGIREYLYTLQLSVGRDNFDRINHTLLAPREGHVHHCFDYLRQALMCSGDMTVEWPRVESDGSRFAVDGWGVTHQCKSWVILFAYPHAPLADQHPGRYSRIHGSEPTLHIATP